ncbi:hypothetical protein BCL80_11553 [Streptomyces avidinii]|uniref:Uncharacterized protein n=1 Tax=Streptomyces glycanivorans TaxID=3033808 RepID=A0ABY9JQG5_9ACTN|nr:hypothetical protein [Streptomyces sp. Alt3]RAS23955.1 hypothetical protein BCL80_11553 [Streptomyces avidinii]WLQ69340.1 hypothetical protein P8A20_38145 [Streptomyces sp. Alt3]SNX80858.1 hypothetical protein SAMN05421860_11353 [Streptomyces microflavus]
MAAAVSTYWLDISEPKTARGREPGYRLYTARLNLPGPGPVRRQ